MASEGERISEAEHAVMEALWSRAPLTAAEVCEAVCADRDWTLATVKTLLSRLVVKGAVAIKADGKRFQPARLGGAIRRRPAMRVRWPGAIRRPALPTPACSPVLPLLHAFIDSRAGPRTPQAPEPPVAPEAPVPPRTVKKVIVIHDEQHDGEHGDKQDGKARFERRIERDGKTIVLRSHRELDETIAEMEQDAQ